MSIYAARCVRAGGAAVLTVTGRPPRSEVQGKALA